MNTDFVKKYKQTLIWYLLFAANLYAGTLNVERATDGNHKILNTTMACLVFTAAAGSAYMTCKTFKKEKNQSNRQR